MGQTAESPFGERLRASRTRVGMSQLALATMAKTTPRHISFIETGRSRPRHDLIVRLARALELPPREVNNLLRSAGCSPVFPERAFGDVELAPFVEVIDAMLDAHDPLPGSVLSLDGRVLLANDAHRRLFPGAEDMTAEQHVDHFFRDRAKLDFLNWPEVAWAQADRLRAEATRSCNAEVEGLADRACDHLADVPRPALDPSGAAVLHARVRVNDDVLTTFSTVMRFETARDVTLSDVRVELIYPADETTRSLLQTTSR